MMPGKAVHAMKALVVAAFYQNEIQGVIILVVAIDVVNFKVICNLTSQPFGGPLWVIFKPDAMMVKHACHPSALAAPLASLPCVLLWKSPCVIGPQAD